jgi:hypothetical protein
MIHRGAREFILDLCNCAAIRSRMLSVSPETLTGMIVGPAQRHRGSPVRQGITDYLA